MPVMETVVFERFRHSTPIQVRWNELDPRGHVEHAAYMTYLEQARRQYAHDLQLIGDETRHLGFLLAQVTIDYRLPLAGRDRVAVYTRTTRLCNKHMEMEQLITRQGADGAEVAAVARLTVLILDQLRAQSAPVPDTWWDRLSAYEPGL